MSSDTEFFNDMIFGYKGAFVGKGEVDAQERTCRPLFKPANSLMSLFGRHKEYPIDVPVQNLIRCDIPSAKNPGQFRVEWVVLPSSDMTGIIMEQTVFGQLQSKIMDELEIAKKHTSEMRLDKHIATIESKQLKERTLQSQVRSHRLKCSACDATYSVEEAQTLMNNECTRCHSQVELQ